MSEIRDKVIEQIAQELISDIGRNTGVLCDCRACHYRRDISCSYNDKLIADLTMCPQDWDFCKNKAGKVLSIPELAIVDREAKLPSVTSYPSIVHYKETLRKEGWVKEVDNDKKHGNKESS